MLSLLRINDPLRLIFAFLLLFAARFGLDDLLTLPEIKWMLLGEMLSSQKVMYRDVWDNTGPFAAGFYMLVGSIFERSVTAAHLLAAGILFVQAWVFNNFLNTRRLYEEKTYVPAFLYAVFALSVFDGAILSPPVLSLTFLIIIFRKILSLNENLKTEDYFETGIYFGIAVMFHMPSAFFLLFILFGYGVYRSPDVRKFFALFFGLGIVIASVCFYYFLRDGLDSLTHIFALTLGRAGQNTFNNYPFWFLVPAIPFFWILLSLLKVFTSGRRFVNYQSDCNVLMFIWLICSTLAVTLTADFATYRLVLFVPAAAYFLTFYFNLMRKKFRAELLFLFCIITTVGGMFFSVKGTEYVSEYLSFEHVLAKKQADFSNKKIVVFGRQYDYYLENKPVTPYLNYALSADELTSKSHYETMARIYENLTKDQPEIIIDSDKIMPEIFDKIPLLNRYYKADPAHKNRYLRREPVN